LQKNYTTLSPLGVVQKKWLVFSIKETSLQRFKYLTYATLSITYATLYITYANLCVCSCKYREINNKHKILGIFIFAKKKKLRVFNIFSNMITHNANVMNYFETQSKLFLEKTQNELEFTQEQLTQLGFYPKPQTFPTLQAGFAIKYKNIKGEPIDYEVFRYQTPQKSKDGKEIKYKNPSGVALQYYYNGMFTFGNEIGSTAYFVEGQKKSAVLNKYSIPCVGVSGINGSFAKTIKDENGRFSHYETTQTFKEFIQYNPQVRNIVFIYDNDLLNHNPNDYGKKRLERYNNFLSSLKAFIFVCKENNLKPYIAYVEKKLDVKAFDDIKNNATKVEIAYGLLNLTANNFVNVIDLSILSNNELELIVGGLNITTLDTKEKYLSNDKVLLQNITNQIVNNRNLAIQAPTGAGKTTMVVGLIKELLEKYTEQKICLVFPTNSLLDSYDKDFLDVNSVAINKFADPYIKKYLHSAVHSSRLVLTTYHSFSRVASGLGANDLVIFDEFHSVITAQIPCEFNQAYAKSESKKLHITATPPYNLYYSFGVKCLKINNFQEKVKLNILVSSNVTNAINGYILGLKNNGINLVFIDNKQTINDLAKLFENRYEVQKWYSCEEIRDMDYYKHFKEKNEFLRKTQKPLLVLATRFIYEGVSFTNKNIATVSICSEPSPYNVIQALKRVRMYDKNTVFNYFVGKAPYKFSTNFIKALYLINNSYTLLTNTEKNETVLREYEALRFNDSFSAIFKDGVRCPFEVCRRVNPNIYDTLASEFVLSDPTDYDNSVILVAPDKPNKKDIELKALFILKETPQEAVNIAYTNTDCRELKKWLKRHRKAEFSLEAKEMVLVGYELEKYFITEMRLEALGFFVKDIDTVFAKRKPHKRKQLLTSAMFTKLILAKQQGVGLPAILNLEANQLDFVYKWIGANNDRVFNSSKEIVNECYQYVLNNFKEIDLKTLNKVGVGTKKEHIKVALQFLLNIEMKKSYGNRRYVIKLLSVNEIFEALPFEVY
jgi:hypothetical protein